MILTDGCCFINQAALLEITRRFGYSSRPTAVQGRIAGAKGLWILHPSDHDSEPKIWIRDSQRKIVLPPLDQAHRVHRIFDILSISKASSSVHLSTQSILNLSYNGVPAHVILELQKTGLLDEIRPLMDWKHPRAMVSLTDSVYRMGNIANTRLQRLAIGASRILGLSSREWLTDDIGAERPSDIEGNRESSSIGRNIYSGGNLSCPGFSCHRS